MNNIYRSTLSAAVLLALLGLSARASAQPMEGIVEQDGWSFTWDVMSTSGLRVRSVMRNGVKYLHDGSLPAMRVQYDNDACGPYLDRIKWDNITPDANGNKVRVTMDANWIRVWVQAQLASYRLIQSWWFSRAAGATGSFFPELSSSGLQCTVNHRHHPYWRLDFDVSTGAGNRSWTYKNGVYTQRTVEFNTTKALAGNDVVIAPIADLTRYANLRAGPKDGTPDAFSDWDIAGRVYPSDQNDPYNALDSSYTDPGDLEAAGRATSSGNGENMDNADVVYWYSAHLVHLARQGPTQQLVVGPRVFVVDN